MTQCSKHKTPPTIPGFEHLDIWVLPAYLTSIRRAGRNLFRISDFELRISCSAFISLRRQSYGASATAISEPLSREKDRLFPKKSSKKRLIKAGLRGLIFSARGLLESRRKWSAGEFQITKTQRELWHLQFVATHCCNFVRLDCSRMDSQCLTDIASQHARFGF